MNNQRTYIELSQKALNFNVNQIKNIIGQTQLAVVVKSNAYGHGMLEIAKICQNNGIVDWICTAGLSEALTLRKNGIKKPMLVLSYIDDNLEEAIFYDIHLGVYNLEDVYAINFAAKKVGKKANLHLKIDTGMSRLGVLPDDCINFIKKINFLSHINIYGIFTHLSDTSNPDTSYSDMQLERFDTLLDQLKANNLEIKFTHAQASSSIYIKPKRTYSMFRAGAAIYGLFKTEKYKALIKRTYPEFDLKSVLSWKTKIISIKEVPANSAVGYDKTFITTKRTKIAILPIGYFEGYSRALSNKGFVLINNQKAPVIGIVSMNLTAIDVTEINDIKINDEVILINHNLQVYELAHVSSLITNEIATRLNPLISRITLEDNLTDMHMLTNSTKPTIFTENH